MEEPILQITKVNSIIKIIAKNTQNLSEELICMYCQQPIILKNDDKSSIKKIELFDGSFIGIFCCRLCCIAGAGLISHCVALREKPIFHLLPINYYEDQTSIKNIIKKHGDDPNIFGGHEKILNSEIYTKLKKYSF